jgi:hypothetical protein
MITDTIDSQVTAIKRSSSDSSLGNIFGYTADEIENVSDINVSTDSALFAAIEEFKEYAINDGTRFKVKYKNKTDIVLTPNEINTLISLEEIFNIESYSSSWASSYINTIFQNSYNHGYNDFNIDTKYLKDIDNLFQDIEAVKERPFNITVNGNLHHYAFDRSKYVHATINGNSGANLGFASRNSSLIINGNTQRGLGNLSKNLTATVLGNVGDDVGNMSYDLVLFLKGNAGKNFGKDSHDLTATVLGNLGDKLGCGADSMTVAVKSDQLVKLGKHTKLKEFYFSFKHKIDLRYQNFNFLTSNHSTKNKNYIAMMKEIDRRFEEW